MDERSETRDVSRRLLDLIEWVRDKLERLHRGTGDEYVRGVVHALIRACDPDTNPRLRATLDDMRRGPRARRGGERRWWRAMRRARCERCYGRGETRAARGAAVDVTTTATARTAEDSRT